MKTGACVLKRLSRGRLCSISEARESEGKQIERWSTIDNPFRKLLAHRRPEREAVTAESSRNKQAWPLGRLIDDWDDIRREVDATRPIANEIEAADMKAHMIKGTIHKPGRSMRPKTTA